MNNSTLQRHLLLRMSLVCEIVLIVLLCLFVTIRIYITRDTGYKNATLAFNVANKVLSDAFLEERTTSSKLFSLKVGELNQPNLNAIILRNKQGISYAFAVNRNYLEPSSGQPISIKTKIFYKIISAPFEADITSTLSISYKLIASSISYKIVRDTLFLFFAILIVTLISLIVIIILTPASIKSKSLHSRVIATDNSNNPTKFYKNSNMSSFIERLHNEVSRATSENRDLALILFTLKEVDRPLNSVLFQKLTTLLYKENFTPDLVFQHTNNYVAIILPGSNLSYAISKAKKAVNKVTPPYLQIISGITARAGRLVEDKLLLQEAETALRKASQSNNHSIIAFRANKEKF